MGTASPGRRRSSRAGTHATALEQGGLWGEPSAQLDLRVVRERRGGALLRDAFQYADAGMVAFGQDRVVAELNHRAVVLLGLRKGSGLALDPAGVAGGPVAALRENVEIALHGGAVQDIACPLRSEAGQARQGSLSCRPIRDADGRISGALCTVREVTAATAPPEGSPPWLGKESGRLVHDYNNALTVLLGNLSMAMDDAEGSQAELLLAAQEGALAARRITQELPGRLQEAAQSSLRPLAALKWPIAGWSVSPAVRQALQDVEPRLLRRLVVRVGHAVFGLVGDTGPVWLQADLPPGCNRAEIEIAIGWHGGKAGDEDVELAKGRLHRVLAALGGRVNLTAARGVNALTLRLPLEQRTSGNVRPRILLMDDEQPVRQVAARILAGDDYEVSEASDGQAALALFCEAQGASRPFDLAVLDLTVPGGMGGEEAGRRLREIDPDVPILISSGRMHGLTPQELRHLGFAGTVPKPYTASELRSGVRQALAEGRRTSA